MPETETERLLRIVGNHSVMLHNLQEKVEYLMKSHCRGDKIEVFEILSMLNTWVKDCNELHAEDVKKLALMRAKRN